MVSSVSLQLKLAHLFRGGEKRRCCAGQVSSSLFSHEELFGAPVRGRWCARHDEFTRQQNQKPRFPSLRNQHCPRSFLCARLQDPRVRMLFFLKK